MRRATLLLPGLVLVGLQAAAQTAPEDRDLLVRANAGDAEAQHALGTRLKEGRKEPVEAAKWFRKASAQGHACACNDLGMCYASGEGVTVDPVLAMQWFQKAAEKGHVEAMFNLGVGFHEGMGTKKDLAQATAWFLKAAQAGHPSAMLDAGIAFEVGEGVAKDRTQAYGWYEKAEKAGEAKAKESLQRLRAQGFGPPKNGQENAAGIIHGPNHAYSIQAPKGWVLDNAIWADQGIFAVFYPADRTFEHSPLVAYSMVQQPAPGGLEAHIQADLDGMLKGVTGAKRERRPSIKTQDGRSAAVFSITGVPGKNPEWVAYVEAPTVVILVSVSARDPKTFPEGEALLKQLVASIFWFTDRVDYK